MPGFRAIWEAVKGVSDRVDATYDYVTAAACSAVWGASASALSSVKDTASSAVDALAGHRMLSVSERWKLFVLVSVAFLGVADAAGMDSSYARMTDSSAPDFHEKLKSALFSEAENPFDPNAPVLKAMVSRIYNGLEPGQALEITKVCGKFFEGYMTCKAWLLIDMLSKEAAIRGDGVLEIHIPAMNEVMTAHERDGASPACAKTAKFSHLSNPAVWGCSPELTHMIHQEHGCDKPLPEGANAGYPPHCMIWGAARKKAQPKFVADSLAEIKISKAADALRRRMAQFFLRRTHCSLGECNEPRAGPEFEFRDLGVSYGLTEATVQDVALRLRKRGSRQQVF